MYRFALIAIPAVIVVLLITFVGGFVGRGVEGLLGPPDVEIAFKPVPGAGENLFAVPTLTPEQIAMAKDILVAHPMANRLLNGNAYSIEAAPVVDSDSEEGAGVVKAISFTISLQRSKSVEGSWLLKHDIRTDGSRGARPQEVPVHMPACAAPNGVTTIIAMVDITEEKVVQLEPLGVPGFDVDIQYCEAVS